MEKMQRLHSAAPLTVFSEDDGLVLVLGPGPVCPDWPSYLVATIWTGARLSSTAELLSSASLRVARSSEALEIDSVAGPATLCASPGPLEIRIAGLNGRIRAEPHRASKRASFDLSLIRGELVETVAARVSTGLWLEFAPPKASPFVIRFFMNPPAPDAERRGRGSRSARPDLPLSRPALWGS